VLHHVLNQMQMRSSPSLPATRPGFALQCHVQLLTPHLQQQMHAQQQRHEYAVQRQQCG
jgi:hypothetical protein